MSKPNSKLMVIYPFIPISQLLTFVVGHEIQQCCHVFSDRACFIKGVDMSDFWKAKYLTFAKLEVTGVYRRDVIERL